MIQSPTGVEFGKSLIIGGAQLRLEDHINSETVLCSNDEAIFESLPLDLLLDQLLEALFVIHGDFYNLHFNEKES